MRKITNLAHLEAWWKRELEKCGGEVYKLRKDDYWGRPMIPLPNEWLANVEEVQRRMFGKVIAEFPIWILNRATGKMDEPISSVRLIMWVEEYFKRCEDQIALAELNFEMRRYADTGGREIQYVQTCPSCRQTLGWDALQALKENRLAPTPTLMPGPPSGP